MKLLSLYKQEWTNFTTYYLKYFIFFYLFFFISCSLSYFVFISQPDITNQMMESVTQMFEEKGYSEDDSSFSTSVMLFTNNTVAAGMMFVSGFAPIVVLPALIVFFNSVLIGIVLAGIKTMNVDMNILELIMKGLVPHGVFEITAIVIAASLGTYISIQLIKLIMEKSEESFANLLKRTATTFILVVIPLLFVAAIVEGYVTPILLDTML